jgi:hypothetical protein
VVAVLAAVTTTCSLATARAAIRATKAEVPTLANPDEPPARAGRSLVVTRRWHTRTFGVP